MGVVELFGLLEPKEMEKGLEETSTMLLAQIVILSVRCVVLRHLQEIYSDSDLE